MPDIPVCARCRWLGEAEEPGAGHCHRWPPVPITQRYENGQRTAFVLPRIDRPEVSFCGEFQKK
jgi:hypothetical protein